MPCTCFNGSGCPLCDHLRMTDNKPLRPTPDRAHVAAGNRGRQLALHVADDPAAPDRGAGQPGEDLPDDDYDTSAFIERLQPLAAGVGPMLHRTYGVRIIGSGMTPEALIGLVTRRLNQAAPEVAEFRKTSGRDGGAARGRRVRGADARPVGRPGPGGPPGPELIPAGDARAATWRRARSSSGPSRTTAARCASRSSPGPGPATRCRPCSTTSSGWPRRSSSTCGPISASGPRACPAAARRAASPSGPARFPGPSPPTHRSPGPGPGQRADLS